MTLQDKLDAFKADFEANVAPAEAVQAFHRSNRELIDAGRAERALRAGDVSPAFSLRNAEGSTVTSDALLARGPLVLSFYRGVWCPYCNLELKALEDVRAKIEARGASLVAVSLQNAASSRKSKRDNGLSFPILTDAGGELSRRFGLLWQLPEYLVKVFQSFKVELPALHDEDAWRLPMPARYVIDRDGSIAYGEVNPDYTRRPEPSDLFPVLDRLQGKAA